MRQKRINRMFNLIRGLVVISLVVHLGWTRSVNFSHSGERPLMQTLLSADRETVLAGDEDTASTRSAESPATRIPFQPAFSVGRISGFQF